MLEDDSDGDGHGWLSLYLCFVLYAFILVFFTHQYSPFTRESNNGDGSESLTHVSGIKENNPVHNRTQEVNNLLIYVPRNPSISLFLITPSLNLNLNLAYIACW